MEEDDEKEELAKLQALASAVSDSSESEASDEEDRDSNLETNKSSPTNTNANEETLNSDVSGGNETSNLVTVSVPTCLSNDCIVIPDSQMDKVAGDYLVISDSQMDKVASDYLVLSDKAASDNVVKPDKETALPSMSSLQDIFNSIETAHSTEQQSMEVTVAQMETEEAEEKSKSTVSNTTVGEYNELRSQVDQGDLFSDYPVDGNDYSPMFDQYSVGVPGFSGTVQYKNIEVPGLSGEDTGHDIPGNDDTIDEHLEESDSSSSDEEMPVDFSSMSELCLNWQDHLTDMLRTLQNEMQRNLKRQQEIEEKVFELSQSSRGNQTKNQHVSVTKKALSIFGSPYFKDQNLFGPPPNADTKAKQQNKELDVWLEFPKPFSKEDRKKLKEFVRKEAISYKTAKVRDEKESLGHKMNAIGTTDKEKEEFAEKIKECNLKIKAVQKLPDDKLFLDRYQDYDWDKISVTYFQSAHTPRDCQLQWQNLVHPSINRSVWSPEEDKILKKLAEATGGQNWDEIARLLETNRTPHACFVRYMTRHNVAVNNRKWERSEDERLRRLVAHCRINDFIPWAKVSYYMDRRTKDQCYQRYVYSLKDSIRKGSFEEAEDMILIIGEKLYGNDWAKICEMLPCRTPIQLHCRFNSFLRCEFKAWSQEEDLKLLELVRKHGLRDWVIIAKDIGGHRTRSQVRQRFQFIYKNFKKNPAMALDNITYDDDGGIAKRRQEEIFEKLSLRYKEWKDSLEQAIDDPDAVIDDGQQEPRYGQMAGKSSVSIQLPTGEIINNRDLTKFIRYIQTFLPPPEKPLPLAPLEKCTLRTLPEHREELFQRPVARKKNPHSGKVRRIKRGGYRGRGRKAVKNRDRFRIQNFKTKVDRDIAKFFRPTWVTKGKPRHDTRYTEKELELLVGAGQALGKILKLDKIKWDQNTSSDLRPNRELQLLQSFRHHQLYGNPSPQLQLNSSEFLSRSPSGPKVQRTYGKSYSRTTVKQSNSRSNTPVVNGTTKESPAVGVDTINLVPPCQATVMGFRGVLLRNQYLRDPNNCSESIRQERDSVDNTVRLGVSNPEFHEVVGEESEDGLAADGRTKAHIAADKLLVTRFLQLFLWPAKMSATAPPRQENLFSDSDDDFEVVEDAGVCATAANNASTITESSKDGNAAAITPGYEEDEEISKDTNAAVTPRSDIENEEISPSKRRRLEASPDYLDQ